MGKKDLGFIKILCVFLVKQIKGQSRLAKKKTEKK